MLVIFDWDGTLSDSTGKIVRCVRQAAQALDLPHLDDDSIKEIIGLSLPRAIQQLYPALDANGVQHLAESYSQHYVADKHQPAFYAGALEALETLKEEGFLLAVATGKSRKGLNRALREMQLENMFDATRCADETASKPDPKMLQELLLQMQISAQQAVMVGDTEFDMSMAQALAMPRVAVTYGAHSADRLKGYQPLCCVDNLQKMVAPLLVYQAGLAKPVL